MTGTFGSGHPTSLELIGLLDGDEGDALARGPAVVEHVASCRVCLAQLLTAAGASDDAETSIAFEQLRLPEQLLTALLAPRPAGVAVGQLWRLTWDEMFCLAVITNVDDTVATVVAAGDTDEARAFAVDADVSPLGVPLDVHVVFETVVSLAALDTFLGHVDLTTAPVVGEGDEVPPEVGALRLLAERSLAWAPPTAEATPTARPLRAVLDERGVTFDDLADAVGDEVALALWRGERVPTEAEGGRLESLGVAATAVPVQRAAPVRLLRLVTDISFKRSVRAAAERRRTSEAAVRRRMVDIALAPAARTTGANAATTVEERWRVVIEHELRS